MSAAARRRQHAARAAAAPPRRAPFALPHPNRSRSEPRCGCLRPASEARP